ncbi:hypothetical protein [Burkholderia sp. Ed8]|uniref:hypothetical protein n=1 Tax=Burkholderia sp. Ed8 TaxID=3112957 RepID=UPI00345C9CBF
MSADIPAVALDVVRMERHVEPVGAHASCLVRAIRFAYRHRDANRRDDRAGQRRQARRDRPFGPTAHVSDECILRIHIDVAHRKTPGRMVMRPGRKTPSLGTRMVRGKYMMWRAITKYY